MHLLFKQVLEENDLSRAGELFSLADCEVLASLPEVLSSTLSIIQQSRFLASSSQQSVVEIVITRVTSVIRDTDCVERHVAALLSLLDACLLHDLSPLPSGQDSPHAKIASDLLACIFLSYASRSVMLVSVPVAVRFLQRASADITANLAAYLSLVAIDSASLLHQHMPELVASLQMGNYQMIQVLLAVCSGKPQLVCGHVGVLLAVLQQYNGCELVQLVQLLDLVVGQQPQLLAPGVPRLCELVAAAALGESVWCEEVAGIAADVLCGLSVASPASLTLHISRVLATVDHHPTTLSLLLPVLCTHAQHANRTAAHDVLVFILSRAGECHVPVATLVAQLRRIVNVHPQLLPANVLQQLPAQLDTGAAASTLLLYINTVQGNRRLSEENCVTIVKVGSAGSRELRAASSSSSRDLFTSRDHLRAKMTMSSRSTPRLNNQSRPAVNASVSLLGLQRRQFDRLPTCHSATSCHPDSSLAENPDIASSAVTATTNTTKSGSPVFIVAVDNIQQQQQQEPRSPLLLSDRGATTSVGTARWPVSGSSPQYSSAVTRLGDTVRDRQRHHTTPPGGSERKLPSNTSQSLIHHTATPVSTATCSPLRQCFGGDDDDHNRASEVHTTSSRFTRRFSPGSGSLGAPRRPSPLSSKQSEQRVSVIEPYQLRDTLQHFCEKHLDKIKAYIQKVCVRLPLPVKCTIEERKGRKTAKLHFVCQIHSEHCLYSKSVYPVKTKNPRSWIHLMFLTLQSRSSSAISSRDPGPNSLKNCWNTLHWESTSFLEIVTGCFPSAKEIEILLQELRTCRFFDVFEYNGLESKWACFLCNHPDKAEGFAKDQPVIEGQLKEKRGRWKMFRRWRTRYFTLSGGQLHCCDHHQHQEPKTSDETLHDRCQIGVHEICSVRVNRTSARSIPRAFEIFTHNRTYVLKAKDGKQTEEWVRCLSVALARQNSRPSINTESGNSPVGATSAATTASCRHTPSTSHLTTL